MTPSTRSALRARSALVTGLMTSAIALSGGKPAHAAGIPGTVIEEAVVTAKRHELLGQPVSASQGIVLSDQLMNRPILRTAEVLEVVPGLIVTQHSGDGKANQYFLRGFNLDHGTDFASTVDSPRHDDPCRSE